MSMVKMLIHLPAPLKAKLDGLRSQGYTASGFIRALLERELNEKEGTHYGRQTS
jgi:metal-responsive CopG/Arc/MetJ family transcriptional regulator